jgi:hypothetical protein
MLKFIFTKKIFGLITIVQMASPVAWLLSVEEGLTFTFGALLNNMNGDQLLN